MNTLKYVVGFAVVAALAACGGGGGNPGTVGAPLPAASAPAITPPTTTANASVATIRINPGPGILSADGTSFLTFTVFALTGGNASVTGATIDLAATNGVILSSPSVVTSATSATAIGATVTMIAVSSDQASRVSTLTASCTACTASPATVTVNVVGASIALNNSGVSSLVVGGPSATLTATVKDVFAVPMSGVTVSFAATDSNVLNLSAPTGMTNGSGVATVAVSGLAAGSASINVSAMGNAKSQAYISGLATTVLAVTSPANNSVMVTGTPKLITVSAPGASTVTFTTTRGTFGNGATSQNVAVASGTASATLTSLQAGTATVTMIDSLFRSANLTLVVSPPVSAVNKVLLNANQTTLPITSASGTQSSLTLTARAVMFDGVTDQSVANVPIEFSMSGGPGGGEVLTPALAYTNSSGYATATFTAGTAASIPNGITVSAKVQNSLPVVQTNVQLTIGGQALSVAFGPASVLGESSDKTLYIQAYSVQVADANNNPVSGQVVTLRMRPVAFSTGTSCTIANTYCSEDVNANGSLELGEDGTRTFTTVATAGSCPSNTPPTAIGSVDGILTPPNSDGGSVPSTVITDASGIAAFNLTYLKGSAFWIINKLTATVSSNGTETSKSTIFRLVPSVPDVGPPCSLPASSYSY